MRSDHWQLTVDCHIPDDTDDPALRGVHRYPPTLPYMALPVTLHLRRSAPTALAGDPLLALHRHPDGMGAP